jgi:uncharacterized membrane protein (UPF0127 family)
MRTPIGAAAILLFACASTRAPAVADAGTGLPVTRAIVSNTKGLSFALSVEVVATAPLRNRGLMFRKSLDTDKGMLFVFPEPSEQTFWMHNTLIPLDMLFIAGDGTVLGVVEQAEPLTDTPRSVRGAAKFVLEVIGGWCADRGVGSGARVQVDGLEAIRVQ